MNRNRMVLKLCRIIMCSYLMGAVGVTSADEQIDHYSKINLSLQVDETIYTVGEPIDLIAVLKNSSSNDNRIGGSLNFRISYDGVNYKTYLAPQWGIDDSIGGPLLKAKSTMKQEIRILHNTPRSIDRGEFGHIAFPVEGDVYIKADMLFRDRTDGVLKSNILKLQIVSPKGNDIRLLEVLKSRKSVYFLHTAKLTKSDNIKNYTSLVEQYPDSVYAKILTNTITDYHERRAKKAEWDAKWAEWKLEEAAQRKQHELTSKIKRENSEEKIVNTSSDAIDAIAEGGAVTASKQLDSLGKSSTVGQSKYVVLSILLFSILIVAIVVALRLRRKN